MSSSIQLRARNDRIGNAQAEFDFATGETIQRFAAVILDEDFLGPGHSSIPLNGAPATGYPWVQRTQKTGGSPTVTIINNFGGGAVQLALDATAEKQEASLYANDMLNWDVTKSVAWEARINPNVLPSLAAVEMVWGLRSAWIDGPDNFAFYIDFQMLGSGALNVRCKDGVTNPTAAARDVNGNAITLVAGAFRNFRIDANDPTNVQFFVDGVQCNAVAMPFAAVGPSAILQPYASVYKASGAGLGTIQVDSTQVSMNRS
jgi:hypothetical protein